MSEDEVKNGLRSMTDSGRITASLAHEAMQQPLEGAQLVRLDRIEKETSRQSSALFGDKHLSPPGDTPGLLKDVRELKFMVFQAKWTIVGAVTVCTSLLTVLGLVIAWVEAAKH